MTQPMSELTPDDLRWLRNECELPVADGARYTPYESARISKLLPILLAERDRLIEALPELRRAHQCCEDGWYSCPKSVDGCLDGGAGPGCNCGADEHNAKIDELLARAAVAAAEVSDE